MSFTTSFYASDGLGDIVHGFRADRWDDETGEPVKEGSLHLSAVSAVGEVYKDGDTIEDGDTEKTWDNFEQFRNDCKGMVIKPRKKAI